MRKIPYTVWIVLVVFLLATNITFIVSSRMQRRNSTEQLQEMSPESEQDSLLDFTPSERPAGLLMRQLNLNTEQQTQFRQFHRVFNRSANDILSQMEIIRSAMADELKASKPNKEALDTLAHNLGKNHKELKLLTFQYYFQMKEILDSEQQKLFVDVFADILSEPDIRLQTPRQGPRQQGPRGGTRPQPPRYFDSSSTDTRRGGRGRNVR
ncbi:MAG TPA: periplasmic heavy metal sensor [Bacteroidales bacterium]|nr:periplasmic heavy metal sensor [Bacteroidales bacterium]